MFGHTLAYPLWHRQGVRARRVGWVETLFPKSGSHRFKGKRWVMACTTIRKESTFLGTP